MPLVILMDFDGTAYDGDLAVQAYARRIAELVDPATAARIIGAMRAFLEGGPALTPAPAAFATAAFATAEDGYELVHELSDTAGIADDVRRAAYARSRDDLARSAFAVDAQPGLADWLGTLDPVDQVWLVTNAPPAGVDEVLGVVGLTGLVHRVIAGAGKPAGLTVIARAAVEVAGSTHRVLGIGDRWAVDLAGIHAVGGRTAHIDRFGRGFGTPTWRARELAPLLPALNRWSHDPEAPVAHALA